MQHSRKKFLIGGLIVAAAVGYLAYAGFMSGKSYYLTVDSFMAEPQYHAQHVRLRGKVGLDKYVRDDKGQKPKVDFHLLGETGGSHDLHVYYEGMIPDLFKPGTDVVVEGKLGENGVFKADKLFTKCASKYDAAPAASRPETPS